jgi:hypothetical protein
MTRSWQYDAEGSNARPDWNERVEIESSADQISTEDEVDPTWRRNELIRGIASPVTVPLHHTQAPSVQDVEPAKKHERESLGANAWWVRKVNAGAPLPWELEASGDEEKTAAQPTHKKNVSIGSKSLFLHALPILNRFSFTANKEAAPKPSNEEAVKYNQDTLANTKQHLLQIQRDRERQQWRHRPSPWYSSLSRQKATAPSKGSKLPTLPESSDQTTEELRYSWSHLLAAQQDPAHQEHIFRLEEQTRRDKRDQLVVLLALGYLCPLAWIIGGFFWSEPAEDLEERLPLGVKNFNIAVWRIANRVMVFASATFILALLCIVFLMPC